MIETYHITSDMPKLERMMPMPAERQRGAVFLRTFSENLPGVLGWGLGYGLLIAVVAMLYPIFRENNMLLGVVRSLGLLGVSSGSLNAQSLTSFSGYLALQALGWAPLVLSIYVIPQALNIVSREEERGTLDILLSTPLSRAHLLIEKTLATVASLACILLIMELSLHVSASLVPGVEIEPLRAVAAIWHILPILLVILAVTLMISLSVRGSRSAGGLAALFVLVSYFLRALTDLLPHEGWLDALRKVSIFAYYKSIGALMDGFQWQLDAVLLIVAALVYLLALRQFDRRDLGL